MLSTLGKIFSRRLTENFSYFSQKTGFDIPCKLSPMETICMKCQILFSEKNKKKINLLSAELAKSGNSEIIINYGPIFKSWAFILQYGYIFSHDTTSILTQTNFSVVWEISFLQIINKIEDKPKELTEEERAEKQVMIFLFSLSVLFFFLLI